jgi:hypothetical protein
LSAMLDTDRLASACKWSRMFLSILSKEQISPNIVNIENRY